MWRTPIAFAVVFSLAVPLAQAGKSLTTARGEVAKVLSRPFYASPYGNVAAAGQDQYTFTTRRRIGTVLRRFTTAGGKPALAGTEIAYKNGTVVSHDGSERTTWKSAAKPNGKIMVTWTNVTRASMARQRGLYDPKTGSLQIFEGGKLKSTIAGVPGKTTFEDMPNVTASARPDGRFDLHTRAPAATRALYDPKTGELRAYEGRRLSRVGRIAPGLTDTLSLQRSIRAFLSAAASP